ncbi:uroporphyrinogen decarboxylase [bacterium BMS3Abin03]|nr:uroporphyrinogen decarboxylase [bacterium BMS3Abin03]MCG6959638.1 uroporphyrinogen decarboxylase [bacterium BMS3Abin03]
MEKLKNDLLLRACKRKPVDRTPIWIMRQAGRYLPEYRAIREKHDFLTMCKTPELAAEVTIQPVDIIGVDAAIIFSDILVIPEAMGMKLQMIEGDGPVFDNPVRTERVANKLKPIDPSRDLKYVLDAISLTKKELYGRVPLIGFSGAPWTLLTYMVEGQGTKTFSNVKKLIYNNPELAHNLLKKLTTAVAHYLTAQIRAGANAVQIFDTWAGILSPRDYLIFALKYVNQLIAKIKRTDEPVIYFPKGVHYRMRTTADCGADVIGIDWTIDMEKARDKIGKKVAIQGNLDPNVLYAEPSFIKREAKKVLASYGKGTGHIFNLGHGILPDVDPAHAKVLVDYVKDKSKSYHQ